MTSPAETLPFNDILALLEDFPPLPVSGRTTDEQQAGEVCPPQGMADWLTGWLAGWQGGKAAVLRRPVVALFAAAHADGVVERSNDTVQRVTVLIEQAQARTAPVCHVCDRHGLGLRVFEMAPELPVADIVTNATMEEADCAATMAYGMEATAGGADLLIIGAVAAGHAGAVAAMAAALLGPETSPDNHDLSQLAAEAVTRHRGHLKAPLEILRRMGGRETAALAGAILAARLQQVPVVLDGAGALCAALLLERLKPGAAAHCVIAADDGHRDFARLARELAAPVLLGGCYTGNDGTAGALAAGVVQSVVMMKSASGAAAEGDTVN